MTRRLFTLAGSAGALAASRTIDYEVWDVFTDKALSGNQLAVFFNADGLDAETMLAITREMNYSESTFLQRRSPQIEKEKGIRTRIFLRTQEIPFAGHPTLGTAFALWNRGGRKVPQVTLDLTAGSIPVRFSAASSAGPAVGIMTQPEPIFAETHDAAVIAKLIGTTPDAIDTSLPLQNVSTGRPNILVMLRSRKALESVQYDWPAIDAYFAQGDKQRSFYLMTRETRDKARQFHTRKIGKGFEDPVTGSAAGSAIAWLVQHGAVRPDERVLFEQGTEIQREGQAIVSASRIDGKTTNVQVGGSSVLVMRGTFQL